MEQRFDFTIADLSSKCRSKTELYNLLTRDGKLYLPPPKDCNKKFLRKLMQGDKLYISCKDVKVIKVPQFKGLAVSDILKFAATQINIASYLPEYEYSKEPNREWICNLINSLIPDQFTEFIRKKEEQRRKQVIISSNLAIKVKSEFLSMFKSSQAISTLSGKSHLFARDPTLGKTQRRINELKEEKKEIYTKMMRKLTQLEYIQRENDENNSKLAKLYDAGIIDEKGEYIDNCIN